MEYIVYEINNANVIAYRTDQADLVAVARQLPGYHYAVTDKNGDDDVVAQLMTNLATSQIHTVNQQLIVNYALPKQDRVIAPFQEAPSEFEVAIEHLKQEVIEFGLLSLCEAKELVAQPVTTDVDAKLKELLSELL